MQGLSATRIKHSIAHVHQVIRDFNVYYPVSNIRLNINWNHPGAFGQAWRPHGVIDYLNIARIDDGDILRGDGSQQVFSNDYIVSVVTQAGAATRLNADRAGCFQPIIRDAAIVQFPIATVCDAESKSARAPLK